MQRIAAVLAIAASLLVVSAAEAGWAEFWHRVHVDWHRMNCWPEPFQHADREVTRAPQLAMLDAGWRLQNTLSDHFFDPASQTLTKAGQLKLRWIVTQTPMHRRTVHVFQTIDAGATVARVQSVQAHLARLIPDGPRPEVLLTDKAPWGGSGEYFDSIDRQLKTSVPPPRVPAMGGANGG